MSQQPPNNQFVPPPPPSYSPYGDDKARQAAVVASEVKTALILSILGFFCFGFILGILAFRAANRALETIDMYDVAHEKRGLAMTAKVLSIVDIVLWGVGLILRIAFMR